MRTVARWLLAVLVCGVVVATAGCTGDDDPAGNASPTPRTNVTSSPSATEEAKFDCAAVAAAQQALGDATTAELERLAIDRGDQRAFTVTLVVASQQAAQYWEAVRQAAQPSLEESLRRDLDLVAGYWQAIDVELDAIPITDSSDAAIQKAAADLTAVSSSHPQAELAPAQQRVQDVLADTCGTEPAPAPTTS